MTVICNSQEKRGVSITGMGGHLAPEWGVRFVRNIQITNFKYFYNSSKQVKCTNSIETNDSVILAVDSVCYSYTGNNVTKETHFSKNGDGPWFTTTFIKSYDNMKNFYKTMCLQKTNSLQWTENNLIQIKYADSANAILTRNFSNYNAYNYPTEYTEFNNTPGSLSTVNVLTYKCQ